MEEETPGNPSNPIDVEDVPPEYKDGDTPGKPIDLATEEEDPQCVICLVPAVLRRARGTCYRLAL